jgi:hypothetical protein
MVLMMVPNKSSDPWTIGLKRGLDRPYLRRIEILAPARIVIESFDEIFERFSKLVRGHLKT